MDSKAVHRIATSLKQPVRFDSKIKVWSIGALTFTAKEIAKMSSADLRAKVHTKVKPGETLTQTAKQMREESKDGNSDVAKAMEIVRKQTGGKVTSELKEHAAAKGAKGAAAKGASKKKRGKRKSNGGGTEGMEAGVMKIDGDPVKTPKHPRDGLLWLKQWGIHKWALRTKAKLHDADSDVQRLLRKPTQFYTPGEIKQIAKVVFNKYDRTILDKPDEHSKYAVKVAETCKKIAEAMLKEANGK